MIFNGVPDQLVRLTRPLGKLSHFRFDGQGHYTTENERLIKRLQHKFTNQEPTTAKKEHACKKCGFVAENGGLLLIHYKVHKKEVMT